MRAAGHPPEIGDLLKQRAAEQSKRLELGVEDEEGKPQAP